MLRVSPPGEYIKEKIGIATVLFNSGRVLPDFLESLRTQTRCEYTVYAVDNASADESVVLCRAEGERFRVIENADNTGFAHATNQGIRFALEDGCEIVLILNNDVAFGPNFLYQLLQGLRRNNADIVAPLTYYHDRPNIIWAAGGMLQRWFGYRPVHLGMDEIDTGQFSSDRAIQFAPGSCIFADRSVFSTIGLLDESYFTYWEDTDFAIRAVQAGLRNFLIPEAKLWHKVSSLAGKSSPFQIHYATRNHALYICKHCATLPARLLSISYLLWYRIMSVIRRRHDSRIESWKEGINVAKERGY
jgi:GT2 family glycosyltransferase